jgi:hypothetical protein
MRPSDRTSRRRPRDPDPQRVHTGEVELDGDNVHGVAVHIAARVAALAGPSEVLVSQTVKDLVAGSGLTFEDAGEHELKGVPDRWHLYRADGGSTGQHQVKGADRTKRYSTELLRSPKRTMTSKDAGQSVAWAFLDTEEVRGSNPLAPTSNIPARAPFPRCRRIMLDSR